MSDSRIRAISEIFWCEELVVTGLRGKQTDILDEFSTIMVFGGRLCRHADIVFAGTILKHTSRILSAAANRQWGDKEWEQAVEPVIGAMGKVKDALIREDIVALGKALNEIITISNLVWLESKARRKEITTAEITSEA